MATGVQAAADRRPAPGRASRAQVRVWLRAPEAWLVLVAAAGLALRLPWLHDSLFGDEVGAFYDVAGHGLGRTLYLVGGHSPELNPPLFFVLAWASLKLFGTSAAALRLVSIVAGTLTIPLTYALGRRTVSQRAGLLAAAVVAVSPFLVWYAGEARPYALLVALVLASTLALLRALEQPHRAGWWAAYALSACAATYTHFVAVFPLALQLAWALVTQPRARRPLLIANLTAAALFLPWLPSLLRTLRSPGTALYGVLEPLSLHAIRVDLGHVWLGSPYVRFAEVPGIPALALAAAGVLLGLALLAPARYRGWTPSRPPAHLVLIGLLALGLPALTAVYSAVRPSVWNSRNIIACWPGLAVLLAWLLTRPRRLWALAPIALVLAGLGLADVRLLGPSNHRPDWQGAADLIARSAPGTPVVNWPDLSPGPPSELEVALQIDGGSSRHPVIRLGAAPLASVLRAPPYAALAPWPGERVARRVVALAGHGELLLALPARVAVRDLEGARRQHVHSSSSSSILVLLAAFLGALPARFHIVAVHTWPGLHQPTVYVFRQS